MSTSKTVTVYTKPDCGQCDMTKKWLDKQGVDYNVESILDDDNLAAAKSLGLTSAPVVMVGADGHDPEAYWAGFRPDLLGKHLGAAA